MKETLKKWYQKLWKSDYELLEDPDGYSCTSWIIVKTIATIVCIFVIPCVAAYVYVYVQINKSIAERKVFTYRNARLFIRLSFFIGIGGGAILIVPLATISDHLWVILLLLFNSLGSMALNLAGWMIHKGIKMQEEQDLTI